jgi:hypothetical protein
MSGLREERRRRSARFQLEQAASRRDPLPFSVRRIVKPAKQRPIDAAEELALRLGPYVLAALREKPSPGL